MSSGFALNYKIIIIELTPTSLKLHLKIRYLLNQSSTPCATSVFLLYKHRAASYSSVLRFSHRDKREARVTGDETQGTRINAKAPARPFVPSRLRRAQIFIDKGYRRQRVNSASDSQSGGSGFKSPSGNLLDLFSVVRS